MMYLDASQIRAARALLDWTIEDLAKASGLNKDSIKNAERSHTQPRTQTIAQIREAFEKAGIEFIADGGVKKRGLLTIFEGQDSYLRMMQDAEYSLSKEKNPEILFAYVSDSYATSSVIQQELRMRTLGIKMRCLIKTSDSFIRYPFKEYRLIPDEYWHHNSEIVYSTKVAVVINMGEKVLIVNDSAYATARKLNFEHYWRQLKAPTKTTADVTYE